MCTKSFLIFYLNVKAAWQILCSAKFQKCPAKFKPNVTLVGHAVLKLNFSKFSYAYAHINIGGVTQNGSKTWSDGLNVSMSCHQPCL